MNYFECVAASHGGGSSNTITVTCDSGFAGVTLTCTDGNDTYTKVCPSVSPYTVDFENLAAGDWTISGTVQGTSYSKVVSISDSYATTLESGFSWATWVDLSQNYHSADYNNLAEVFADESALYELMTIHACCDYLIDAVSDGVDVIDDFVANDTAMKWIGLRDYVCDGLTAINGVEAKFLASQYWERYLKDHVPTMTSNTAPYGVASGTSSRGAGFEAYRMFDNDDSTYLESANNVITGKAFYKFTTPILVKKYSIRVSTATTRSVKGHLVASNDGINWIDLEQSDHIFERDTLNEYYVPDNNTYYLQYGVSVAETINTSFIIATLQFYGRALNVSVPIMTSNTAPFGECLVTNDGGATLAYKAFDNDSSTNWGSDVTTNAFIGYDFGRNVCIKQFKILPRYLTNLRLKNFKIEVSEDKLTWEEVYSGLIPSASQSEWFYGIVTDANLKSGRCCRLLGIDTYGGNVGLLELQFYGVDYSEREFEPNTNKKWLYDHGLELETITTSGTVTKGSNYLTLSAANSEATATVDLTNYSLLRGIVGDHMSGTTQLSVGGSNPAAATLTSANAPNNNSLDISSLSQSLATGVKMTANGICDITELWVE